MPDPITPPADPAPVTPPADPAPPAPTAVVPAVPVVPVADDSPWTDPAKAEAEIRRLRAENGKDRTDAKKTAAEQAQADTLKKVGELLGFIKPEDAAPDLAKLTADHAASQAEARQTKVALAVYQNALTAGGDPLALLDSASFLEKAATLDPTDSAAIVAAVQAAVAANPRLGAAPGSRLPAPNPAQGSSGSGAATVDIDAQIDAATKAGDLQLAIALKQERSAQLPKS